MSNRPRNTPLSNRFLENNDDLLKEKEKEKIDTLLPTKIESWAQGEKRHCPIDPSMSIQKSLSYILVYYT